METITYEKLPHIVERQYAAEQAFLAEFQYILCYTLLQLYFGNCNFFISPI